MGTWCSTVRDMGVPYILPQENGNRTDVRWMTLENSIGDVLRISGYGSASGRGFDFNATHVGADQLWAARHWYEIKAVPETLVNLDVVQRGLGTSSCGPDTLERYRVRPGMYELRLAFSF